MGRQGQGRGLLGALAWAAAAALLPACQNAADTFTSGRIENRCNGAIPACSYQAGCVLGDDQYLRAQFPGGQRVIVRTETDQARLVLRVLLLTPQYPGTELLMRAYSTGCSDFDERQVTDMNLFDVAGDDGILEYHLDVTGRGDHVVELFSDMASDFLFVVEIED